MWCTTRCALRPASSRLRSGSISWELLRKRRRLRRQAPMRRVRRDRHQPSLLPQPPLFLDILVDIHREHVRTNDGPCKSCQIQSKIPFLDNREVLTTASFPRTRRGRRYRPVSNVILFHIRYTLYNAVFVSLRALYSQPPFLPHAFSFPYHLHQLQHSPRTSQPI